MKQANYAPVYAGLYPELAEIARKHGYAMAVHGSFARDADLICIPWTDEAADPQIVVDDITTQFVIRKLGDPNTREHGRIVYTLTIAAPSCFIDLSFTPRSAIPATPPIAGAGEEPVAWQIRFEDDERWTEVSERLASDMAQKEGWQSRALVPAASTSQLYSRIGEISRSAGEWEDLHRELFEAVMSCTDPEDRFCGLHPGPERDELEAVIARQKTVHDANGPYASDISTRRARSFHSPKEPDGGGE